MKPKNAVESLPENVQDLLVPELKALKVSVESLQEEVKVKTGSLRHETKVSDESLQNEIYRTKSDRCEMKFNSVMRNKDKPYKHSPTSSVTR